MSAELKSLKHNEVDFERPEWVTAMEDTVRESDARHTVIKKTLVRWGASECCVATFLFSLRVRSFRLFKFCGLPDAYTDPCTFLFIGTIFI